MFSPKCQWRNMVVYYLHQGYAITSFYVCSQNKLWTAFHDLFWLVMGQGTDDYWWCSGFLRDFDRWSSNEDLYEYFDQRLGALIIKKPMLHNLISLRPIYCMLYYARDVNHTAFGIMICLMALCTPSAFFLLTCAETPANGKETFNTKRSTLLRCKNHCRDLTWRLQHVIFNTTLYFLTMCTHEYSKTLWKLIYKQTIKLGLFCICFDRDLFSFSLWSSSCNMKCVLHFLAKSLISPVASTNVPS